MFEHSRNLRQKFDKHHYKGSKLSSASKMYIDVCDSSFQEMASSFYMVENVAKQISAWASPGPHWGSLQRFPDPLLVVKGLAVPLQNPTSVSALRPRCLHPKHIPEHKP